MSVMDDGIVAAQELLDCLYEERRCLTQRDHEALLPCVKDKARLITILQKLTDPAWLPNVDQPGTSSPEETSALPVEPSAPSPLADLLRACHKENAINGMIIGRTRRATAELLAQLQGARQNHSLYGHRGQATAHTTAQDVSSASVSV